MMSQANDKKTNDNVGGEIKFEKVTKKFGSITALDDVSFEVKKGEFVFITGPSGAGKTTLVKLIIKQIFPTTGSILVDGIDLKSISSGKLLDLRRKVGVVFQDLKLLSDRTVFENVALVLEVLGKDRRFVKDKVERVLKLVGLEERKDLFPAQLAGGELQRVCIARAVVAQPKILIADEPTGNLDPSTSWQIVKIFKKINNLGMTVIMATHNVDIVNSLKLRTIHLDKGKILANHVEGKYETF